MPETTLISVIMTNFNKGNYLRSAIESVLVQTYGNFELIIVDDGSSDDSPTILEELRNKDPRIVSLTQANKGKSSARNVAIGRARGQFATFLDSDDVYARDKLGKQIELFRKFGNMFISYTDGRIINEAGNPTGKIYNRDLRPLSRESSEGNIFSKLVKFNHIIGASVMIPIDYVKREKFDVRLSLGEDYDLWVRLARVLPFRYISEPLYGYRMYQGNSWSWSHADQVTVQKNNVLMYEKWLRTFKKMDSEDKAVIVKRLWNNYLKSHNRLGLLKLALRYRLVFSLFLLRMKSSLTYRIFNHSPVVKDRIND